MPPRLRESLTDLSVLSRDAAAHLGVDPAFVEKDFWVTELLRAVSFGDEIALGDEVKPVTAVFKGGTSLSRVYRLISRFSEDVDVLLVFPEGAGTNSRDKAIKRIVKRAHKHLGPDDVIGTTVQESTTGVKRNVLFSYPRSHVSDVTREELLLEMGSRGGPDPHHMHAVRSMVAEYAIDVLGESDDVWEEFAPVEVAVLAAERTLVEKLALLHNLGERFGPDDGMAREYMARAGRHYYDVHQLLSSDEVCRTLEELGPEGFVEMVDDVNARSEAAGWRFVERPAGGYAASRAFDPLAPGAEVARRSYGVASGMVYGPEKAPTFDECLAVVRDRTSLL